MKAVAVQARIIQACPLSILAAGHYTDSPTTGRCGCPIEHEYDPRPGDTWCRQCNSGPNEAPHACPDCEGEDGSSGLRRACSNCDRVFAERPRLINDPFACATGHDHEPNPSGSWCRWCGLSATSCPSGDCGHDLDAHGPAGCAEDDCQCTASLGAPLAADLVTEYAEAIERVRDRAQEAYGGRILRALSTDPKYANHTPAQLLALARDYAID